MNRREQLAKYNEGMIFYDGLDACLIGIAQRCNNTVALYDYELMIGKFMYEDDMTYEEAIEWIDYNILGGWLGDNTPMIYFNLDEL